MMCSVCGNETSVLSTRSLAKPGRGAEVNKACSVVEWYTSDFVARKRKSKVCNHRFMTVEMSLEDVSSMNKEAAKGHAPID